MKVRLYIAIFLLTGFSGLLQARQFESERFVFRGETIEEALNQIVDTFEIDLVYEPDMDLSSEVYVDITTIYAGDVISEILKGSQLDYIILSTGTYVLIKRQEVKEEFGSFFGYVYDQETGIPIENATILLADASNSTATNENGFFSVSPLSRGIYSVIISSVGYSPQARNIQVYPENDINIIRLTPKVFISDPIVVKSEMPSLISNKLYEKVSFNQLSEQLPGDQNSVIRNLNLFTGLTFNYATETVSIQGSDPASFVIQLDGVTLYNTQRASSVLGMFSPYSIGRIEIARAGDDEVRNLISGNVINFQQLTSDRNTQSTVLAQLNPNTVNLRNEWGIRSEAWNLSTSFKIHTPGLNAPWGYQESYNDWNRFDPLIQNFLMGENNDIAHYHEATQRSDVRFADFHFVAERKPDAFSTTKISGYYGYQNANARLLSERTTLGSNQPEYVYSNEQTATDNVMINVQHEKIINATTDLNLKSSFSSSSYNYHYFMLTDDDRASGISNTSEVFDLFDSTFSEDEALKDENNIFDISTSANLTKYLSAKQKLRFGIDATYINHQFLLKDLFYFPLDNERDLGIINAHLKHFITFNRQFRASYSLNSSVSTSNRQLYVNPGVSLAFDSEYTRLGFHSIQLNLAMHRQYIGQFDITNIGPSSLEPYNRISLPYDESVSIPLSYQAGVSWTIRPKEQTSIGFEGYYRLEPNDYTLNYAQLLQEPVASTSVYESQNQFLQNTRTQSHGFAISLSHEFTDPQLLVTLIQQSNITKQRFPSQFDGNLIHTYWSEPFSSSMLVNWRLSDRISVLGTYKWIPTRYWAFTQSYYDFLTTHNAHTFGEYSFANPDDESLDDYFRADLGFNFTIPVQANVLKLRIDLQNITHRQNELSYFLIPVRSENGEITYQKESRNLPGFIPSASVQFEF